MLPIDSDAETIDNMGKNRARVGNGISCNLEPTWSWIMSWFLTTGLTKGGWTMFLGPIKSRAHIQDNRFGLWT